MTEEGGSAATPERRVPRQVTPTYLERAALAYLERYASSVENLRRVLRRKVQARCRLRGEDPAAFFPEVDAVVARALKGGFLDDARYAEGRVASLRRRGGSTRLIRAKLGAKGVGREAIEVALTDGPGDEAAAAAAFARRRRLGPFRPGERMPYREKDLASLVRAGFSFAVARQVIDSEIDEEG